MRSNMIANYLGQGWTALMGVVFVPLYIQLLGIESYGLIGFFMMLQVFLTLLDLGILPTSVREMARFTSGAVGVDQTRDLLRSFELICCGIAIVLALVLWLAAGPVARQWLNAGALPEQTVKDAVALIGVVLGTRLLENLYRSCLIGLQRQVWLNVATASLATIRSGGAVLLLMTVSNTIELFFIWQALISLLTVVILGVATYRTIPAGARPARFSRSALASIGHFAVQMLGINLLATMLTQIDKMLLSSLLPLAEYGYYMLAATVTGMLYMFTAPITQAVYPTLVQQAAANDTAGFAQNFHRGAQLLSAVLAPMGIAMILFARPLLFAWSGDAALADAAAPLLSLLAIGTLANGFMQMPYYAQVAHGWTSFGLKVNLVAVVILVPAILLLVPQHGPPAAAIIWASLNFSYLLIAPIIFRRLMPGEQVRWYLHDLCKPALAATLVLGCARLMWVDQDASRWVQGGLLMLVGGLALVAALATVDGMRSMVHRLLLARGARLQS